MEAIYVLEALSHVAHDITSTVERVKNIRELALHLAACNAYLKALRDSHRRE